MREALYFLYPKVSQPGDFYGSDQSPNLLGTERTGPDLSQESGWHPGRLAARALLRPAVRRSALADAADEVALLGHADRAPDHLRRDAERQVRPAALRRPALLEARRHDESGLRAGPTPASRARTRTIARAGTTTILSPPKDQLEEAPNLAQIDRSYWLSGNPLPVTEQNLLRGKEVFLQRCVGCHGIAGDGKGPGASFMSPPPPTSPSADDACCGGDTGPGDFYYRILRGWPGTAMENFGDRLSVDDIWRVVLFVKTIPNDTLRKNVIPEPKDYIVVAAVEGAARLAQEPARSSTDNASFAKEQVTDPFMQEAMRVFPGLAPGDTFLVNDGKTPLSLAGRRGRHQGDLRGPAQPGVDRGTARAATSCPPKAQKAIPPTVPGQQ